jgi:SAM-dependent methyltransferase
MGFWAALRHPRRHRYARTRARAAERFVTGRGIEIGALHAPFPAGAGADVRYVDRLTTEQLRAEYPELAGQALVEVDVVDDGERLSTFEDAGLDFVIASHFLEHCEDPIGTLDAHLRTLRPGGVLVLALPDRRRGVDREREPTPLAHLVADHDEGGDRSRAEHYRDWATLVDLPLGNIAAGDVAAHAADLERRRYSIHFHCWTAEEFGAQLRQILPRLSVPAAIVSERANQHEFLVVLRREGA